TGIPTGWGNFAINKYSSHMQNSAADPVPSTNGEAYFFSASVSPPTGKTISTASVQLPDMTQDPLTVFGGVAQFFQAAATEAELDTSFPPGAYTLSFTFTGQSQQAIGITMPANAVPVPKITNFGAAQNVTATADFALQWNGFPSLSGGEYISFSISD